MACSTAINQDSLEFQKNSEAISNLLSTSEAGKTAEEYRKQLFPVINGEQIQERDQEKKILFNEESFKKMRKGLRPDLD